MAGAANCAARMVLGEPTAMAETNRDGVKEAETKILHEGREGVERVVPVLKRGRKAKGAILSETHIVPIE